MSRMMLMLSMGGAVVVLSVGLGGCQSAAVAPSAPPPVTAASGPAMAPAAAQPGLGDGPGISVSDALKWTGDEPVLVNGYVRIQDDQVQLCEQLTASQPPDCVGPSMPVQGLELTSLAGLGHSGDVTWTTASVQLLGEVQNGALVVSGTSQG